MTIELSREDKKMLLKIAREAIQKKARDEKIPVLEVDSFAPPLRKKRASFVTLTKRGALRGCIGTLEAEQPLVEDVQVRALAAAFHDFRFPPVSAEEIEEITIEVSVLTKPRTLDYESPEDLVHELEPGLDGVVLSDGHHKATFLPQVWDKLQDVETFLSRLCYKMGVKPDLWQGKKLDVKIYRVIKCSEDDLF
ncbi:MAG: AmmeMemoRadiSam system protein A [Anaerolineales bacterium]|nr:AmmeMemoRadiSam system protein A [Anaerolineales bacterium]